MSPVRTDTPEASHAAAGRLPHLCFIGPLVGRTPGRVTTPALVLADLFSAAGYPVSCASPKLNRYARLADIVRTLTAGRGEIDIQLLSIYGGRSFVVEDVASAIGKAAGQRVVMALHGGALPEFMARFPRWTGRVLRRADAIVVPSEFLARAVRKHGFEARVIPNVLDLAEYPYRHRRELRPKLLWMRTFHPIWNPEMALRALAALRRHAPDAQLVMAGEDRDGYQREMSRRAAGMGLGEAVRFAGFLDAAGKREEGASAEIYVNTNRVDNMPVAVLEACAMGLPVVSTAVGGVPDLLSHESTGLLVPDNDHEAMAAALHRLLQDAALAARLSAAGRRLAEQCAWERVRAQWEELFDELAKKGNR